LIGAEDDDDDGSDAAYFAFSAYLRIQTWNTGD
jgi:hypothetical protein